MNKQDLDAIETRICEQFDALNWSPNSRLDKRLFTSGFMPESQLVPAKRPAAFCSVPEFLNRMQSLQDEGALTHFSERGTLLMIRIVGNIAVALAGCEMTENLSEVTRDVSAFLLIKSDGRWQIAAQAWDLVDTFPPAEMGAM